MKIDYLSREEFNAILAGLRLLADGSRNGDVDDEFEGIASDSGHMLTADEIDGLAERINLRSIHDGQSPQ